MQQQPIQVLFVAVRNADGVTIVPTLETPQGVCTGLQSIATVLSLHKGVAFSSGVARELAQAARNICDRIYLSEGVTVNIGAENLKFIYRWVYNMPISDVMTSRM